jgi:hypothetical protein
MMVWCNEEEDDEQDEDEEQDSDREEEVISGSCRPHINRFLPCGPVASRGRSGKLLLLLLLPLLLLWLLLPPLLLPLLLLLLLPVLPLDWSAASSRRRCRTRGKTD